MKTSLPHIARWSIFTGRPAIVAIFAGLNAISVWAGGLDLGSPTSRTPYDQYLGPIWVVMNHLARAQPDEATVARLVSEGRAFRYSFNPQQPFVPQTPDVTEATRSGDCKAKALWLASKMDTRSVRFVIGKASASSPLNHAWLIWNGPEGWLILDATMLSRPLSPERCSSAEYIPNYSYSPDGKFAHAIVRARANKYSDHL